MRSRDDPRRFGRSATVRIGSERFVVGCARARVCRSVAVRRRSPRRVTRVGVPGARGARGSLGHVRFRRRRVPRDLADREEGGEDADGDGAGGNGRGRAAQSARGFAVIGNERRRRWFGGQGPARVERVHAGRRRCGGKRQGDGAREAGRGGAQAAGQGAEAAFAAFGVSHATVQVEGDACVDGGDVACGGKGDGPRDHRACMSHATRDAAFSRCLKFD